MSRSKEQPGSSGPEKAWMRSFGHVLHRDSGSTGDGTGRQTEMRKTAEKIHGRREDGWPYGGGSKPKGEMEALWRSSEQKEKNAMRGDSLLTFTCREGTDAASQREKNSELQQS